MKKMFLMLFGIAPVALVISCGADNKISVEKIVSVHDGDTITTANGEKLRIFGIDTPEIGSGFGENYESTKGYQYMYASEGQMVAEKLCVNSEVKVERVTKGVHGRSVSIVSCNGHDLAVTLLQKGLARVQYVDVKDPKGMFYSNKFGYYKDLIDAQYQGAKNHLGIWKYKNRFKYIFPSKKK